MQDWHFESLPCISEGWQNRFGILYNYLHAMLCSCWLSFVSILSWNPGHSRRAFALSCSCEKKQKSAKQHLLSLLIKLLTEHVDVPKESLVILWLVLVKGKIRRDKLWKNSFCIVTIIMTTSQHVSQSWQFEVHADFCSIKWLKEPQFIRFT